MASKVLDVFELVLSLTRRLAGRQVGGDTLRGLKKIRQISSVQRAVEGAIFSTVQVIVSGASDQFVVATTTEKDIVFLVAAQSVVAGAAVKCVPIRVAGEKVPERGAI